MNTKHEHKTCQHELKHCSKCDIVYCEGCSKEWTLFANSCWTYTPYNGTTEITAGNSSTHSVDCQTNYCNHEEQKRTTYTWN